MKKILILNLLFFIILSCSKKDKLETGIELYNNKNYSEAKLDLEKAVELDKSGKASYYLGNVLLNLKEYNNAITNFKNSYDSGYEKINSEFNIACAYSLMNNTEASLNYLLSSTKESNEIAKRVFEEPYLLNFRNSKDFSKYQVLKNYPLKGITPTSKDELLKYIFDTGSLYEIDTPNQDTWFEFHEDGRFFYKDDGGSVSIIKTGTWEIDEANKKFILTEVGECQQLDYIIATKSFNEQRDLIDKGVIESNDKKYVWNNKYTKPIIDEIDFKDIELNITNYFIQDEDIEIAIYNKFGNFENNKIIKKEIGRIVEK